MKGNHSQRNNLIRGSLYFIVANFFCCWLIALRYLFFALPLHITFLSSDGEVPNLFCKILVYIFFALSYVGHFALLTFIAGLPLLICSILFPQRLIVKTIAIITGTLGLVLLIADVQVFTLFRFHLNPTVIHMMISGNLGEDVLDFSNREWLVFWLVLAACFCVEFLLSYWCWKKTASSLKPWAKKLLVWPLVFAVFSYACTILSAAANITQFAKQSAIFPLYENVLAQLMFSQQGSMMVQRLTETGLTQLNLPNQTLRYPLHPLQFGQPNSLPNILIIGIDSWRFDMLNTAVTPAIYAFSQGGIQFTQHFSGGNATQPGLFSLFYSLPSNYWTAMLEQQRSPVFMDTLQKFNYQLGIFVGSNLHIPDFSHTIFLNVPQLQTSTPGKTAQLRDGYITAEFKQFLGHLNPQKPFFSFLFYDSAHAYCTAQTFPKPFQPSIDPCNRMLFDNDTDPLPYFNRYKNAVHFIDAEISSVFKTLSDKKLLENTIVIITGDHGQEFNDNHLNYWEHASNFTRYQIQTPLVMVWPGKAPATINYRTSHYDVVPTLLQNIFQNKNPIVDYSIGQNLFNPTPPPFLIVGSYAYMGLVEPQQITNLLTSGSIEMQDSRAMPLPAARPNLDYLKQALGWMQEYVAKGRE